MFNLSTLLMTLSLGYNRLDTDPSIEAKTSKKRSESTTIHLGLTAIEVFNTALLVMFLGSQKC